MNSIENLYFEQLKEMFGKLTLNRKETAQAIGISLSQLDKLLRAGVGLPDYKRIGRSAKARIVFPIASVAKYLAATAPIQGGFFEE
jgi:transcriptional regulator with XRE-family HTH domain